MAPGPPRAPPHSGGLPGAGAEVPGTRHCPAGAGHPLGPTQQPRAVCQGSEGSGPRGAGGHVGLQANSHLLPPRPPPKASTASGLSCGEGRPPPFGNLPQGCEGAAARRRAQEGERGCGGSCKPTERTFLLTRLTQDTDQETPGCTEQSPGSGSPLLRGTRRDTCRLWWVRAGPSATPAPQRPQWPGP